LFLNVAFIVYESNLDMNEIAAPRWVEPMETFFSMIYVVDVLLRLMVMSFSRYWAHGDNRFDFIVSWVLFLAGMNSLRAEQNSDVVRYLNILRFVRLMKLLKELDRFKKMCACIEMLGEVLFDMVVLLLVTITFYAAIGSQAFGGKLYGTNPVLEGTDYVNNGYDILNFNDMCRSVLAIFVFMVNNFCPEYAEAMDIVTGIPWLGFIFCGSFFFLGVSIVFNIFSAFTIDIFIALKSTVEQAEESEVQQNLLAMRKRCAEEGKTLRVTIPVEVLRMRVQNSVLDDLDGRIADSRELAIKHSASFREKRLA